MAEGLSTAITEIKTTADGADKLSKQLGKQLGDLTIVTLTEAEYEALEEKDTDTIYLCTENEEE